MKCNRMRLLLDQRKINNYLSPQHFSNKSLHKTRGVIEEEDVCLQFDYSVYFYHFRMAEQHREYIGCTLGPDGPLGGRYFVWNAAPMGVATSPWMAQSMAWVLAKKYRRMGIRLISYCDDTKDFCKQHEAAALAAYYSDLEQIARPDP